MSAMPQSTAWRGHPGAGFSLVELLVAMAIGVFLIAGALTIFSQSRSTVQVNDTLARLQENARFALDTLEPDIREAGFWGRHNETAAIQGRANNNPIAIAVNPECEDNWAIQLDTYVAGTNNEYPDWDCGDAVNYKAGTDVLSLRRADAQAVDTADLRAGEIYLRSSELPVTQLFQGINEPPGLPVSAENYPLVAHAYYVRNWSLVPGDNMPSLQRLQLGVAGGNAVVTSNSIINGVEDMQFQVGVDTDGDGSVNRYVNPDNQLATAPGSQVRAVRIWLLMRADDPELGFEDDAMYRFADRNAGPDAGFEDHRRMLVSRTVFLRNQYD